MADAETRIIAVDWSGDKKHWRETIWLAEAAGDQIICLENGRSPEQLAAHLNNLACANPRIVVGFDFAFGMPGWFARKHGASIGPEFWEIVALEGEVWLDECPCPFVGKSNCTKPPDVEMLRVTEKAAPGAKPVFKIGGQGSVGVGSLRGMPMLRVLREAGWKIWPFDPPGFPLAVEIYPRLYCGPVNKSVWKERLGYLETKFPELSVQYTERAAGSQDAFDAAVSALVMSAHSTALMDLPESVASPFNLEGCIWNPYAPGYGCGLPPIGEPR